MLSPLVLPVAEFQPDQPEQPGLAAALERYWRARTIEEEREAYWDARRAGLPPAYGEQLDPTVDDPWQFGGWV